jgi:signal transduction histidine kinase
MKIKDSFPLYTDYQVLAERLILSHGRLLAKLEAERRHVADILNDSVIQSLLALHIQLSSLAAESLVEPGEKGQMDLADSLSLIANLVETLRVVAREAWPLELDTVGLNAALQQASEDFGRSNRMNVVYNGEDQLALPKARAMALYRFAQEALDNVYKHAEATKVRVTLCSDDRSVQLKIEDNGKGFLKDGDGDMIDPLKVPGLGLFGLMIHFQQLNGRIIIQSRREQGTIVTAELPYP